MPNSSALSAAPLHLIIEQSRALTWVLIRVHGLAGIAALMNSLPLGIKVTLLGAVGLSLYLTLCNHVLDPAVSGLLLNRDGGWEVTRRSGPVMATLADSTVATPWIVILHLVSDSQKIPVLVPRDSVDPESFRRLRVHLRVTRGGNKVEPMA